MRESGPLFFVFLCVLFLDTVVGRLFTRQIGTIAPHFGDLCSGDYHDTRSMLLFCNVWTFEITSRPNSPTSADATPNEFWPDSPYAFTHHPPSPLARECWNFAQAFKIQAHGITVRILYNYDYCKVRKHAVHGVCKPARYDIYIYIRIYN